MVGSETLNEPVQVLTFMLNVLEYVVAVAVLKLTVMGTAYAPAASVRLDVVQLTTQELIETHAGVADPKVQVAVYPHIESLAVIVYNELAALTV